MKEFNLLQERWVPCRRSGTYTEESLRTALCEAHEIDEICHPVPTVVIGIMRLLIALFQRAHGPEDDEEWKALYFNGKASAEKVNHYLDEWTDRFWLFDDQYPFYQCAALSQQLQNSDPEDIPLARLTPMMAAGNNPTLFDHTYDAQCLTMTPADVARYLVGFQACSTGGTLSYLKGVELDKARYSKAAPLARGAVVILRGGNLYQTLVLNAIPRDPDQIQLFGKIDRDAPAWEHSRPVQASSRRPEGHLDYLTWQSRRALLAYRKGDEGLVVNGALVMAGWRLPDGASKNQFETMMGFVKDRGDTWSPIYFHEGRSVWRDSVAFMAVNATGTAVPRTIRHLSRVSRDSSVNRAHRYAADFLGCETDQQKVEFWRRDRLIIDDRYLVSETLLDELRVAIGAAEKAAQCLRAAISAYLAGVTNKVDSEQKGPDHRLLSAEFVYWSTLDLLFSDILLTLPDALTNESLGAEGLENYRRRWQQTILRAALNAFDKILTRRALAGRQLAAYVEAQAILTKSLSRLRSDVKGATNG
jgi:CRISPR system Cascade subunit CasA